MLRCRRQRAGRPFLNRGGGIVTATSAELDDGFSGSGFRRSKLMHVIRIPADKWGPVWRALVAAGPVSRVSQEPVYVVSDEQLRMLRKKRLPFELLPPINGRTPGPGHA